jgi:Flp pilus assembly protein TadD/peroxiredoxin
MTQHNDEQRILSRRALLKSMGLAPLLLRPAPFYGASLLLGGSDAPVSQKSAFALSDVRLTPRYPTKSPLADVIRFVPPGSDDYITEKYAFEIEQILEKWGDGLKIAIQDHSALTKVLDAQLEGSALGSAQETKIRTGNGIEILRRTFAAGKVHGPQKFVAEVQSWLGPVSRLETAEFEIYGIQVTAANPLTVSLAIRYDLVAKRSDDKREERVGSWLSEWFREDAGAWKARTWTAGEEIVTIAQGPTFIDVTSSALGGQESYAKQLRHGVDYWRTVLDGAIGVDVYGNNGVAAGDYDNDGFDDLYVCQPAGLPNRLYRNRGDGTFEDVTEKAGVGVLDNTACALFADLDNRGLQDLVVVCGTGPLLFQNQGNGTFVIKHDAFSFANPPQGTFTHAAIADYDNDGRLDIYFCMYMYYLGLDQYHYPIPYFDARNGPPNCLMHNEGGGKFVERTQESGLNADNDRYSFACAWGDSKGNGLPDIFVANDFGSSQLYRNNGDGTFSVASAEAHIEEVGAGMGCSWADIDNDGRQDIYVTSMWEAAGQRVSDQQQFHPEAPEKIRELYQRHARGNALYKNQGDGKFKNIGRQAGVEMGRWTWSSDFWDFDHDGYSDLYVANGYISGPEENDLASFFWRQVVAKSSDDATPAQKYERGWNAINELIRSDSTWHGYARNVMFANNRDGTFSEISGPLGLDFIDDSRTFVLADLDHDGRLEVILKNRNAPQLRILHNSMKDLGRSLSFRLKGVKSNRDAIGAAITVEAGALHQTKYLRAGQGFLAQHSKEMFFGVGNTETTVRSKVRWPSGLVQEFENLPVNNQIQIEEGAPNFTARPFAATAAAFTHAGTPFKPEPLPAQVSTWLIDPLKAPEFSLPDLSGSMRELKSLRGSYVLLLFWEAAAPTCREQLRLLNQHRRAFSAASCEILAINVDDAAHAQAAKSLATTENLGFPVLFATEELAGIYNIIYRYLFDRRRDLGIPTSFLLDKEGMIVKVYQGPMETARLLEDLKSVPNSAEDRRRKALPFEGAIYRSVFARNEFTYGVAMFQHGYLDQAVESFLQVVATKPNDPDAYYNLGTLSLRRNDFAQARQYLEKTLALRPNYPEAWNNLGMMAAQEGHPEDAIQSFQQSLKLRPDYAIALLNLGNVFRRQGNFANAQECLNRAVELQPDDPEVNYSLGMLYAQQGQIKSATEFLQKAIDLRPDYPEAINNLGVIFVRNQDYSRAEEEFRTGIRVAPNFDQSYLNLARLFALQNNREKAREVIQELLRLQPENAGAKQALGMLQ